MQSNITAFFFIAILSSVGFGFAPNIERISPSFTTSSMFELIVRSPVIKMDTSSLAHLPLKLITTILSEEWWIVGWGAENKVGGMIKFPFKPLNWCSLNAWDFIHSQSVGGAIIIISFVGGNLLVSGIIIVTCQVTLGSLSMLVSQTLNLRYPVWFMHSLYETISQIPVFYAYYGGSLSVSLGGGCRPF